MQQPNQDVRWYCNNQTTRGCAGSFAAARPPAAMQGKLALFHHYSVPAMFVLFQVTARQLTLGQHLFRPNLLFAPHAGEIANDN
jgi:hypothetical protein